MFNSLNIFFCSLWLVFAVIAAMMVLIIALAVRSVSPITSVLIVSALTFWCYYNTAEGFISLTVCCHISVILKRRMNNPSLIGIHWL